MARVREDKEIPERIPLNEQRKNVLTVAQKPGFVRRMVNDAEEGNRIKRFLTAGWRIVEDESKIGDEGAVNQNQSVGSGIRKHVGGGVNAVLMEIPEEYYKQDQMAKQREIDEIERLIYEQEGPDGSYGKLEIDGKNRRKAK